MSLKFKLLFKLSLLAIGSLSFQISNVEAEGFSLYEAVIESQQTNSNHPNCQAWLKAGENKEAAKHGCRLILPKSIPGIKAVSDTERESGEGLDRAVTQTIQRITNIITGLIGGLAVILIVFHGGRMLTSFGNEEAFSKGKTGLMWSIGGLLLILFAYIIVKTVIALTFLGQDTRPESKPQEKVEPLDESISITLNGKARRLKEGEDISFTVENKSVTDGECSQNIVCSSSDGLVKTNTTVVTAPNCKETALKIEGIGIGANTLTCKKPGSALPQKEVYNVSNWDWCPDSSKFPQSEYKGQGTSTQTRGQDTAGPETFRDICENIKGSACSSTDKEASIKAIQKRLLNYDGVDYYESDHFKKQIVGKGVVVTDDCKQVDGFYGNCTESALRALCVQRQ